MHAWPCSCSTSMCTMVFPWRSDNLGYWSSFPQCLKTGSPFCCCMYQDSLSMSSQGSSGSSSHLTKEAKRWQRYHQVQCSVCSGDPSQVSFAFAATTSPVEPSWQSQRHGVRRLRQETHFLKYWTMRNKSLIIKVIHKVIDNSGTNTAMHVTSVEKTGYEMPLWKMNGWQNYHSAHRELLPKQGICLTWVRSCGLLLHD